MPNVEYVVFHPTDPHRLLLLRDDSLFVWNIADGAHPQRVCQFDGLGPFAGVTDIRITRQNPAPARFAVFSPDGRLAAAGCKDGTVWLVRGLDATPAIAPLRGHSSGISYVTFSPDSSQLASGDESGAISVWSTSEPFTQQKLPEQPPRVNCLTYSPNGEILATAAGDFETNTHAIALWKRNGELAAKVPGDFAHTPLSIVFSAKGDFFVAGCKGGVTLFNLDGSYRARALSDSKAEYPVALSNDGRYMACGIFGQGYELWQFDATGNPTKMGAFGTASYHLGFSPDSKSVINADSRLFIQNFEGQDIVKPIFAHGDWIRSMSIACDGSLIATVGEHGSFRVWKKDGTKYADFR